MLTAVRLRMRKSRIFYGWWIVAGAFGIQVLQTGLLHQSFGTYATLLRDEFRWSSTAISIAFALQSIESGVLGPVQGWMIGRFGPRTVMRFGVITFGLGFMLFSQLDSLLTFYIAFVMTAIGASMAGFMSITTTIINWFERKRTLAMGLMQTGMSVGGLLVPLVAWSLMTYGWRTTAFMSGVIVIVTGLPLAQLMKGRPEDYGLLPDGDTEEDQDTSDTSGAERVTPRVRSARPSFTTREALRTPAFWLISVGHSVALLVVSALSVHLVLHLHDDLNYSLKDAASVVALMTTVMMFGRIAGGFLGDRFEKRKIAALAMFGHAAAMLALAWGHSFLLVAFFAVAQGLAWGVRGPLMQAMRADYFGRASFATIMGFSSMIIMVGTVSGPLLAGLMADHYGNYEYGFTVIAILAALGSILFILARPPEPPARRSR